MTKPWISRFFVLPQHAASPFCRTHKATSAWRAGRGLSSRPSRFWKNDVMTAVMGYCRVCTFLSNNTTPPPISLDDHPTKLRRHVLVLSKCCRRFIPTPEIEWIWWFKEGEWVCVARVYACRSSDHSFATIQSNKQILDTSFNCVWCDIFT